MKSGRCDADAVAFPESPGQAAARFHDAHDLMARHQRQFGQDDIAFGDVQVGVAERAGGNAQADLALAGRGKRDLRQLKRLFGDRPGSAQQRGDHAGSAVIFCRP